MAIAGGSRSNGNENELLLYYINYSYFSQRVLLALYEKKLKFKSQYIDINKGEHLQPSFMRLNSKGEIPVLKDGVKIIPDSGRIIDYLEDNFSNGDTPRIMPERGTPQAQKVREMRELLDNIPVRLITYGCINYPELTLEMKMSCNERKARAARCAELIEILDQLIKENAEFKDQYIEKKKGIVAISEQSQNIYQVKKALDDLEILLNKIEDELASHDKSDHWLCTEKFTVADISFAVLLNRLNFLGLWKRYFGDDKRQKTSAYFKKLQQRDCFKKTYNQHTCLMGAISCIGGHKKCFAGVVSLAGVLGLVVLAAIVYRRNK